MKTEKDKVRVLVVDDELDIRDGSERILVRMECEVLKAADGEAALSILRAEPVSIVLLDLKMPGMDGMDVLRRIREMDTSILVIVITGYATVETAIEAMKRGAYDFIAKPFEPDQLRIVVGRARDKLRLIREAEDLQEARKRTLTDLDTEKSRIRTILESLPNGVVVTNAAGQVVLVNPSFLWLLGLDPDDSPGKPVQSYISDEGFCKYILDISRGSYAASDNIPAFEFAVSSEKYLQARGRRVQGEEKECLGAVVVLADITTMKVLDRLKSEFVAKVSHELRSPLSTIHEQLALVLRDLAGEEFKFDQHLLSRAKEKTQGLISLIGDLLDLSRIESGVICQEPKPIRLDDLLRSIVDFLGEKARMKGLSLKLELPGEPLPSLTADPLALESIFGNLIINAINYTQEGGMIRVEAEHAGEKVRVAVIDNGFGIEARYLDKIFEKFYRVKNEKTRYITGTGLGLSIVKGLLESLGGSIRVASEPDRGSTFTVFLPVKSDAGTR